MTPDRGLRLAIDCSCFAFGDGRIVALTPSQRAVVAVLVRCGPLGASGETILETARLDSARDLRSVFRPGGRMSPAWGTLIDSHAKGCYRLALPAEEFAKILQGPGSVPGSVPGSDAA